MNIYNPKKQTPKKLIKITIKEKSTGKIIVELLPTRANESKAINMEYLSDIEVIRVYE